ncbi:MAG: TolC family protein [Burkholderiales bacterium]
MRGVECGLTKCPARARLSALATAVLLTACATGAPPRAADVALPETYDTLPAGTARTSLDHWWTLYNDPQLTQLTQAALAQGFTVRTALARLEETRALRSIALARFNPQGNLQASADYRYTRNLEDVPSIDATTAGGAPAAGAVASLAGFGAAKSASVSLPVSWEIDLFGRRKAAGTAAQADVIAARFDVEAARAAIAAEVARSLFQARGFKVQRNEATETVRIQRELQAVVAERARRGLAPSSELDRVATDVAQAEAQAEALDAALLASRRALLVVLGSGAQPLATLDVETRLGTVPAVPAALPGELLARRPDVRQAFARVQRAASSVRLAELDFFPRLTLNPGIGITAQRSSFDTTTSFWSLGLGLVVPILDRPRLQAQLAAEGARAEQAVLNYERTVQTAFSETDQALLRLQSDRRRVGTLVEGERRGRSGYDAARKRYELGFAGLTELLDAERAWRATRSALTSARLDALQRSVQVFQALGGGWDFHSTAASAL